MQTTANRNASNEAKKLLNYLSQTAGNKIITGQHTQTNPMEEISYIKSLTGKTPKIIGFELLSYSPNINYNDASADCLKEIYENQNTLDTAMHIAKNTDIILTFTFHWFSPIGGRDKSFYTENTDFDARNILCGGTPERTAFYNDMDVIAEQLMKFCNEKIPILWRPFHESDGQWFWWGAKGSEIARELYKLMFDYYTEYYHLNNLLWVWNCPLAKAYPGDDYVDIISMDIYYEKYLKTDYSKEYYSLIRNTTKKKVAALAEAGYLPDIHILEQTHIPWAYYMTWSKEFCIGEKYNKSCNLKSIYSSAYSITSDIHV
ncbi:MAG: glycosyl hydrolase [Lachnospira sp.]